MKCPRCGKVDLVEYFSDYPETDSSKIKTIFACTECEKHFMITWKVSRIEMFENPKVIKKEGDLNRK